MNRRNFLQRSAAATAFAALPFSIRGAEKSGGRKFPDRPHRLRLVGE